MKIVIVFESMFANTRQIAEAIADGARDPALVSVVNVNDITLPVLENANIVIVGAPTHAHTLSRPATRAEAVKEAADPTKGLALEPNAESTGIREWLETAPSLPDSSRHSTRALTSPGFSVVQLHRRSTGCFTASARSAWTRPRAFSSRTTVSTRASVTARSGGERSWSWRQRSSPPKPLSSGLNERRRARRGSPARPVGSWMTGPCAHPLSVQASETGNNPTKENPHARRRRKAEDGEHVESAGH